MNQREYYYDIIILPVNKMENLIWVCVCLDQSAARRAGIVILDTEVIGSGADIGEVTESGN